MKRSHLKPVEPFDTGRLAVFDAVKLDLAVTALIALAASLLIARLDATHWFELSILAAVGGGSAIRIMLRTHRVARACRDHALKSKEGVRENVDGP